MSIKEFKTDIDYCRFCWMCRHVCTTGRVTGEEIHTARALALLIAGKERGAISYDKTVAEKLFSCCQCGYCKEWCVSNFRVPEFVREARAEIVSDYPEFLPESVKNALSAIAQNGHPFKKRMNAKLEEEIAKSKAESETLLLLGSSATYLRYETGISVISVLKKLKIDFSVFEGEAASGFYAFNLGDKKTFEKYADNLSAEIKKSGAKKVICASPQDYHILNNEYGDRLSEIEVVSIYSVLSEKMKKAALDLGKASYNHNSYLSRYCDITKDTESLFNKLCEKPHILFWKGKQSRSTGSSLILTFPKLCEKIAKALIDDAIEEKLDTLVVSGADDAFALTLAAKGTNIKILELCELCDKAL